MLSKILRRVSVDVDSSSSHSSFAFDGTNSDLARQLYNRSKAGDSIAPFQDVKVPSVVQDRLKKLRIKWEELSGIAQRAALWDSGFGITDDNRPVKIWTLGNYSMADLAVPFDLFLSVGCEAKSCPEPDNSVSFSNEWCGGAQMLRAARCVVEDFEDDSDIHAAMWVTGGNPRVIPTPYVRRHEWKDQRDGNSYIVFAIHTLKLVDEPAWNGCPLATQNEGYGSLVLPCFTTANISNATKEKMVEVEGSAWVSQWLEEDYATENSSGFKMILLVPILGGVIVVIGIFAVLIAFKRRKQLASRNLYEGPQTSPEIQIKSRSSSDSGTLKQTHLATQEWSNLTLKTTIGSELLAEKRIPYDSIVFERMLSKGAFGEVWAADLLGQPVAVKRLLQNKTHLVDEVEAFAREIQLSATLVHPNIVSFVGVAWNSLSNLAMVMEFVPLGDLQGYLRKSFDLLLWRTDKMHMALGIALALEYLHAKCPPIIHRDLKSKNILISKNLDPKLSDFGVSRGRQDNSMTTCVGTPYWSAPEILEGNRYTEQADIYSFGVVLSELDTGKNPYHDALTPEGKNEKPVKILAEVIAGNLRPTFSAHCPDNIRRIGEACCQHDPASRPTASQIVKMLQD